MPRTVAPHKSSLGMDANQMALLAYVSAIILSFIPGVRYIAWLAPIVIYILEKDSAFVRFNAMQAFVLNAAGAVLGFIVTVIIGGILSAAYHGSGAAVGAALGAIGLVGFLSTAISVVMAVFGVLAMIRAYGYQEYRIPIAGGIADKVASRINGRA